MEHLTAPMISDQPINHATADRFDRWVSCMRRGDLEAAWAISDETLRTPLPDPDVPQHYRRVWNGEPLGGRRVLIRCYHGLGDTIQFSRYLPLVRNIAAEVTVIVPHRLKELFEWWPQMAGMRLFSPDDAEPEFDIEVEIMELAHVFRTTLQTIPAPPHLDPAPADVPRAAGLNIGVAWQAGNWDDRRSLDAGYLWRLAAVPGVSLHSIQFEPYAAGWQDPMGTALDVDGIYRTAQLMSGLDLVITVDTMLAHLAGTLKRPVWTMLQADADWRWMLERDDSPWYPTMRLFRQRRQGDWGTVIAAVTDELSRITYRRSENCSLVGWGTDGQDSKLGQLFL